jgi:esterase/lipase
MPPPIAQPTGSKAALITWSVITSILFVVATVLAIFAHVDKNRLEVEKSQLESRYRAFVSDADLTGDLKTSLEAIQQGNERYQGMKLINVVIDQRDELARTVGGQTTSEAQAAAESALTAAKTALNNPNLGNLASAINALVADLQAKQQQLETSQATQKRIQEQLAGLEKTLRTQLAAKDDDLAKARANVSSTESGVAAYRAEKDRQVQEIQARADEAARLAQEDMNRLQAQNQELQTQIVRLQNTIAAINNRLATLRQPVDQIVKQADGKILRTSSDNIVYVNLGTGDQVVPGMSFEVYDRLQGIPSVGDPTTDDDLPKGKASIEILKVYPGSSEARIVRQTPGMTVVENDPIVNIVYDRATKYNFYVYGKFDLDRNGQATSPDADVIKRLVTAWGGRVTDQLNVDTDFVVMGKVPQIPEFTPEEAENPENAFRIKQAQDELAAYDEVLAKAQSMNIPILNQNRFLYFTGYYEQSAR